jgi:hypothetical protein
LKRGAVNIPGKMYRTFSIYRIPAGGISHAEKLSFKTDTNDCFFNPQPDNAGSSFPACPARSAPDDLYFNNFSIVGFYGKFR